MQCIAKTLNVVPLKLVKGNVNHLPKSYIIGLFNKFFIFHTHFLQ